MTIPFRHATGHKTTIRGMVIRAMFFGCRISGEKNGILDEKVETRFNLFSPLLYRSSNPMRRATKKDHRSAVVYGTIII